MQASPELFTNPAAWSSELSVNKYVLRWFTSAVIGLSVEVLSSFGKVIESRISWWLAQCLGCTPFHSAGGAGGVHPKATGGDHADCVD